MKSIHFCKITEDLNDEKMTMKNENVNQNCTIISGRVFYGTDVACSF